MRERSISSFFARASASALARALASAVSFGLFGAGAFESVGAGTFEPGGACLPTGTSSWGMRELKLGVSEQEYGQEQIHEPSVLRAPLNAG